MLILHTKLDRLSGVEGVRYKGWFTPDWDFVRLCRSYPEIDNANFKCTFIANL